MNTILKKILLALTLLIFINCQKHEKLTNTNNLKVNQDLILSGRTLIRENINILIDSVANFDLSSLSKDKESAKLSVGLIDSLVIDDVEYYNAVHKNLKFKIEKNEIKDFKSPYGLKLVKINNDDVNVLFVTFSDFHIFGDRAYLNVKKNLGISMMQATFYFKKEKGKWVFIKKKNSGAIG